MAYHPLHDWYIGPMVKHTKESPNLKEETFTFTVSNRDQIQTYKRYMRDRTVGIFWVKGCNIEGRVTLVSESYDASFATITITPGARDERDRLAQVFQHGLTAEEAYRLDKAAQHEQRCDAADRLLTIRAEMHGWADVDWTGITELTFDKEDSMKAYETIILKLDDKGNPESIAQGITLVMAASKEAARDSVLYTYGQEQALTGKDLAGYQVRTREFLGA